MVMETPHNVRLTAPEIANIWSQYQSDTMAICVYKYMLTIVEDVSIRPILEFSLKLAEAHVTTLRDYFTNEKFPIPHGYTEDDVNLTAPRLFSDEFCLSYTNIMAVNGLAGYSGALTTCVRQDLRNYYTECLIQTNELFNTSMELLLEKGIVSKPPFLNPSSTFEFIQKQNFITGIIGERRPLNCIEISHLFWNLKKIQVSKSATIAFSQVAKTKELKNYLWRGVEMYSNHIEALEFILSEEHLNKPKSDETEITNSMVPPFSDRLMIFHKTMFGSTTIGFYGLVLGTAQRADLFVHHTRMIGDLTKYMEDGMNLMIENKWIEQAPLADNRKELATQH